MAYITPNSTVQFFGDLGLSPNYENTLYFNSVASKDAYFDALTPIATGTAMSYNRAERGFFKIELPMSTLINAGYIRFKNTSFENKWFYAFVRNVEYINNVTTQVNFELDVIMTWMGVFQLGQCFIERQHTLSDAIGANIAEEGLSLGNYVTEVESMYPPSEYVVMLYKTYNANKDGASLAPASALIQGTYVPIISFAYPLDATNLGLLQSFLDDLTDDNRIDEVLGLKLVPIEWTTTGTTVPHRTNNIQITKPYTQIGGSTYAPRNKKLFTYPYKYLEVDNCEGDKACYKYEYFNQLPDNQSQGTCNFDVFGSACTPEVNVMCVPLSYNGESHAYDECSSMKDFPSLAWNVDAYKAYLAQRDSTIFGNIGASMIQGALSGAVLGGAGGALAGAGAGAIASARPLIADTINANIGQLTEDMYSSGSLLGGVLNSLTGGHVPTRMPNETRGTLSSNLMVQTRNKGFYFRCKSITKNYAMMIDSFFDMFGYAIRQHGTPNMNARPNWTYVKTLGCVVHGNLPADDGAKIESIFDSGVRFWKNHNNIGNYSLANAPI